MYVTPIKMYGETEDDNFFGALIGEKTIDYQDNPNLMNPLIKINIRLDQFKQSMEFSRSSYLDAFGNAGGVMGLYGSAIAVILGYFVEIDYTTELIK